MLILKLKSYKKPPLNRRSLLMGFSGGFEQGKLETALLVTRKFL
jgi:hypothetical protein